MTTQDRIRQIAPDVAVGINKGVPAILASEPRKQVREGIEYAMSMDTASQRAVVLLAVAQGIDARVAYLNR